MNLKQIEAFVKVANNRSFSQTAKELYLTQPTISAHISALEEELGVQLFVRTTKGVRVTEEGKKLYLYARQMTELEENIKTLFQKRGEDEASSQQVVIAASTIPAQYLVIIPLTSGLQGAFWTRDPAPICLFMKMNC